MNATQSFSPANIISLLKRYGHIPDMFNIVKYIFVCKTFEDIHKMLYYVS